MQPAVNGTDERLDALLAEIRGLRHDLAARAPVPPDGQISLREPAAQTPVPEPRRERRPRP